MEDCVPKEVVLTLSRKGLKNLVKTATVNVYLKRGDEPAQALPGILLNALGDWPANVVVTSRRSKAWTKCVRYSTRTKPGFLARQGGSKAMIAHFALHPTTCRAIRTALREAEVGPNPAALEAALLRLLAAPRLRKKRAFRKAQ